MWIPAVFRWFREHLFPHFLAGCASTLLFTASVTAYGWDSSWAWVTTLAFWGLWCWSTAQGEQVGYLLDHALEMVQEREAYIAHRMDREVEDIRANLRESARRVEQELREQTMAELDRRKKHPGRNGGGRTGLLD